jgi:hypothetical protein
MEEAQSDTCIYQTFNCETNAVSDVCKQLFLDKEQALYSLTHQVIYTLFATKVLIKPFIKLIFCSRLYVTENRILCKITL